MVKHPAKFPAAVLEQLGDIADAEAIRIGKRRLRILDPFAGVGRIHMLQENGHKTVAVEIEQEWAYSHPETIWEDFFNAKLRRNSFDAVMTSPCYGNRMADHHEAKDASRRNTYRHVLGRPLTKGTSATMQFGEDYAVFHMRAWERCLGLVRPGGIIAINSSNHIRKGEETRVNEFHISVLTEELGCTIHEVRRVETQRLRHGQNHEARVDGEVIIVARTPKRTTK